MRRNGLALLLILLLAVAAVAQVVPPINLNAELLQGGEVALTWDPPPDGLVEDFNDGVADGFEYYPDNIWSVSDGFLKCATWTDWKSAWHTTMEFNDFTLEADFQNHVSTNTRGVLFRADGPQAAGFNGYVFYVAYNVINYSVYKYTNGTLTLIHDWTPSNFINVGVGEHNVLKVVGSGNNFDLYINGNYVSSVMDDSYDAGFVGAVASSAVQAWYDEITCLHGAIPVPDEQLVLPEPGIACDEFGVPTDGTPVVLGPMPERRLGTTSPGNELDEFIEYRIYRDGTQVGTSLTESFTDQLPGLGEFEYTVTAFYDEGESSHAGPAMVNWEAVILDLVGQITTVPPGGGFVYYDATLINTLNRSFNNVDYWTGVQLPNGQYFSPLTFQTVNIPPFINVTVQALFVNIPADAPAGQYTFVGHLGYAPASYLNDTFTFEKTGVVGDVVNRDPSTWSARGDLQLTNNSAGDVVTVPAAFDMSDVWPNPFNSQTSFSVTLPDAGMLTVEVYNVTGQKVATVASGQFTAGQHEFTLDASRLASGLYFVRASLPGLLDQTRKVMLVR